MYVVKKQVQVSICSLLGKHEWREISNEELIGGKLKRTFQCVHCRITTSTIGEIKIK